MKNDSRSKSIGKRKGMRYELVPCSERDRGWAYALKSEVYREVIERQFGPWDESFQRKHFATRWAPNISKIIVQDGSRIGLVAFVEQKDACLLDELQIRTDFQGRGIGRAIIRDLIGCTTQREKPLRLEVLKKNLRAQKFYRKLGFLKSGETATHIVMAYTPQRAKDKSR